MQLFSGRSKGHRSGGGEDSKCQAAAAPTAARHRSGRCRALCCGASRLSVSSSASCSSADAAPEPLPLPPPPHPHPRGLSKLAHGMVLARLQSMIDAASEPRHRTSSSPSGPAAAAGGRRTGVRGAAGGGPADKHHAAILQAFHEV